MATWTDIASDHLAAARLLQERHARSAVSRAYYAVHVLVTEALLNAGMILPGHLQTPAHNAVPTLIARHFTVHHETWRRELRRINRRLYAARLNADYDRRVTVGTVEALRAVRDAASVFRLFGVAR